MKILTVIIPCYNSEAYMKKAIDHVVVGGDDVEVLIVDDGSKDRTLEIAQDYEARYPGIVRAIHQENKGHGGAVIGEAISDRTKESVKALKPSSRNSCWNHFRLRL